MGKKLISVVIPAYNEEKTIAGTVEETIKVLDKIRGSDYELVIVDDGSIDGTAAAARELVDQKRSKIRLESYFPNKGKGFALKTGALAAMGDYILFLDADLEIHPEQLIGFLDLMEEYGADAIIGSKTVRGAEVKAPIRRRIISFGYYFLLKILFRLPIKDTQTGFKLFRKHALKNSVKKTTLNGYVFDLELIVIMNYYKYKIIDSPIKLDELRSRRISIIDSLPMIKDIFKVFGKYYFTRSYNQ